MVTAVMGVVVVVVAVHYGSKQCDIETLNCTLSHKLGSERSERASEQMSAAEHASEASSVKQAVQSEQCQASE